MGPQGFEQTPLAAPKPPISTNLRTESGTLDARNSVQTDPDLRLVVEHWPDLPDRVKSQILDAAKPYCRVPVHDTRRQAVQAALKQAHSSDRTHDRTFRTANE